MFKLTESEKERQDRTHGRKRWGELARRRSRGLSPPARGELAKSLSFQGVIIGSAVE